MSQGATFRGNDTTVIFEVKGEAGELVAEPEAELIQMASTIARMASRPGATVDAVAGAIAGVLRPHLIDGVNVASPSFQTAVQDLVEEESAHHRAKHDRYRDLVGVVADIALVADPGRLMDQVAEQARRLLHADVVYLWLHSPEAGHIYLGATSGGLASGLRSIRIPPGKSMAGNIIESGLPLTVARYLEDHSFPHDAALDRVMGEERIVAAAGVPLATGLRTIGALVAASRDGRSYGLDDVELLRTLGIHAAIAIERAVESKERDQTIDELASDNRELSRRYSEAADLHSTFARVALTGGRIDDLVAEMTKIVSGQLAVYDEDGRMIAQAGDFQLAKDMQGVVRSAANTRSTQTMDGIVAVPVVTAIGMHGVLCLKSSGELRESDIHIVERAAVTAALLLLRAEAEARAAGFRRDDFVNDLIAGTDNRAHLIQRAAQLKFDLLQPYTIHVVRAELQDRRLAHLAHEAARVRGGLAGHCREVRSGDANALVVLLPGLNARRNSVDFASAMKRVARLNVSVAGAGPPSDAIDVRTRFDEASACSDALLRIGGYGSSGTLDDLGFLGLVLGKDRDVGVFVDAALSAVIDYDAEHHTELMRTLEALLSTDGGPTAASQALHVHVSTVKQRMQRLQRLLGDDWRSVDRVFELRLAMKLHRLKASSAD